MACQTLMKRATYIKFAEKNGLVSPNNNLMTSAEACYKYITKNIDFKEEHTGLEDVRIEVQILKECYRQHKKMDTSINSSCWRIPQAYRKEKAKVA